MKLLLQCALIAGAIGLACSCSKRPAPPPPGASVITTAVGTIDLADVDKAIAETNYDAAVDMLIQAKSQSATFTDQQRSVFDQKVQSVIGALMQNYAGDPKAKAAYQRLGQGLSGR